MTDLFNLVAIVLAGVCIGIVVMWQLGYDPIEHLSCINRQDQYESIVLTGQKAGHYYCVHQYADGGKACTHSGQCEGDCMVTDEMLITSDNYYGKVVEGEGECQYSNRPIVGCSHGTIENPTTYCQ